MKNIFLKFAIILGSASLFFVLFFAIRYEPPTNESPPNLTASISSVFPFAADTSRILLQVPDGGVWVNNFYKNAEGALSGNKAVLIKRVRAYDLLYYPEEGRFEISLTIWSAAKDRNAAEQALFNILEVGRADICRLNIGVSSLDSSGNKNSYGLSFCGSVLK